MMSTFFKISILAILVGLFTACAPAFVDTRPKLVPMEDVPVIVAPYKTPGTPQKHCDIRGPYHSGKHPWFDTQTSVSFDDDYLYVHAVLEEPHLSATLTQRDTVIFFDNDFEVFLDPDRDNHLYGEIEINLLNTVWDLLLSKPYKDQGLPVNAWNIEGLKTKVTPYGSLNNSRDTDKKWEVTMAIPFCSLGALGVPSTPGDGDVWHVNFSRVQWHYRVDERGNYVKIPNTPEENWVWSPTGIVAIHHPERWGKLIFRKNPNSNYIRPTYDAEFIALHEVYYAQVAYYENFRTYSSSVEELQKYMNLRLDVSRIPQIELTTQGWRATLPLPPGGLEKQITIIQDGRVEYLK